MDLGRQLAGTAVCETILANAINPLSYKSVRSPSFIMSFTTTATTPSVFTDWGLSNTISYDIVNPRIEVRLICLRSSRQEDGHTAWQVTNSPGTRMTDLQYPRRGGLILEMGPQVDELVNCLTNFLNDEQSQAKVDPRTTADNVTRWTEW